MLVREPAGERAQGEHAPQRASLDQRVLRVGRAVDEGEHLAQRLINVERHDLPEQCLGAAGIHDALHGGLQARDGEFRRHEGGLRAVRVDQHVAQLREVAQGGFVARSARVAP